MALHGTGKPGATIGAVCPGATSGTKKSTEDRFWPRVSTAVSVVLYPLLALTETLLYYDARIRKEGFDVEYLARGDTSSAAPESAAI